MMGKHEDPLSHCHIYVALHWEWIQRIVSSIQKIKCLHLRTHIHSHSPIRITMKGQRRIFRRTHYEQFKNVHCTYVRMQPSFSQRCTNEPVLVIAGGFPYFMCTARMHTPLDRCTMPNDNNDNKQMPSSTHTHSLSQHIRTRNIASKKAIKQFAFPFNGSLIWRS